VTEGRGREVPDLHLSETAGAVLPGETGLKGKPASADGGKGIGVRLLEAARAPELPGQANRTARSPFALTRQRRLRSL